MMLSRLILLVAQLLVAWFSVPYIVRYIPGLDRFQIFVFAAALAVLVWAVGLVLSQVLRDLCQPSSATLVSALVFALIGAVLVTWAPAIVPELRTTMRAIPDLGYPLIGAVLGYHIKR